MPFSSCQPQCPQVFLLHRKASPEGRCLQAGAAAASCAVIQPSLPHLPGGYLCFEPLPVQPFLLETALPLGYTCRVPKASQAHSCTSGCSSAYSTTRLGKAVLSHWEQKAHKCSSDLLTQSLSSMGYFPVIVDAVYIILP